MLNILFELLTLTGVIMLFDVIATALKKHKVRKFESQLIEQCQKAIEKQMILKDPYKNFPSRKYDTTKLNKDIELHFENKVCGIQDVETGLLTWDTIPKRDTQKTNRHATPKSTKCLTCKKAFKSKGHPTTAKYCSRAHYLQAIKSK